MSDAALYPFQKVDAFFQELGTAVDGLRAKVEPYIPKPITPEEAYAKGIPGVEKPDVVPFGSIPMVPMSYGPGSGEAPKIELISQIDAKLHIDSRVIAAVVAEIIQRNRDTYYHGYGSDPTGLVT